MEIVVYCVSTGFTGFVTFRLHIYTSITLNNYAETGNYNCQIVETTAGLIHYN